MNSNRSYWKGVIVYYTISTLITFGGTLLSSEVKWTHELVLETGFEVRWDSEDPDFLTMEISGPTTGYLGVGFSPHGNMVDSDMVIAWVDSEGIPHLKDFHGIGKADPIEDPQQDYFLIAAAERDNQTTVRFHRRWETCDEQHDINIGNDTIRLIWAWHTDDPSSEAGSSFSWHGVDTRGTRNVFMRLPNRPLPFPDGENGLDEPSAGVKFWDLTLENVDIDGSKNSLFMCKLFRFPKQYSHRKHQIIGFRPLITEENEGNILRISVHQCHSTSTPADGDKSTRQQKDEEAMECYVPNPDAFSDETENETLAASTSSKWDQKYCTEFLLSWALGSEGEMFPAHVGMLLADRDGSNTYYKLEVHYDNLSGKQFLDSSGIRIFYTDETRLFSGGLLSVGHRVSPFLAIPPARESFKIYSVCSTDCTRNGIPESGLNVFSVMLHSHETGRKMRLRHVRNGKELSPIAEDGNYTYKYQQHRIMKNEVRIFPGDELVLECEYSTLYRDKFTFGGYSIEEEMCQALISYYPRANLTLCESKPEFQSFFSAFGIRNVIGDGLMRDDTHPEEEGADLLPPQFSLERWPREENFNPFESVFIATPYTLTNVSVAERMNSFDWSERHISKNLENSWKNGRYYQYCEGTSRIPYKKYVTDIPRFQKYKKISNSICRRPRYRNSGEDKTSAESVIIAFALFIKVIFDVCNYSVN